MKKKLVILGLLSMVMGRVVTAQAETVSPYLQDFNRSLNTDDHAFAPTGWSHLVDAFHYENVDYYVNYFYSYMSGLNGTGCLQINSQTVGSYWGDKGTVNDMLITPAITGVASIYVKAPYAGYGDTPNPTIDFYRMTKQADGSFVVGEKIEVEIPTLTSSEYAKVVLPSQPANTYIGIRGNDVYIDDFEAESADYDLKRTLNVTFAKYTGPSFIDADADGNFTISFTARVKNNGDVALNNEVEGYSISLVNASHNNEVLATVPIPEELAIDQISNEISIEATLNLAQVPDTCEYDIVENVSGSRYAGPWLFAFPHKPIAKLTMSDDTKAMDKDTTMLFGICQKKVARSMYLRNMGGAPLTVSNVAVTEGFSVDLQTPLTINPHKLQALEVAMTTDVAGKKNGMLTLTTDGGNIELPLEGETIPADKWFADFEDGEMPIGMVPSPYWRVTYYPQNIKMQCNERSAECTSVFPSRVISPLLHVKEGELLSLDVAKIGDDSYLNIYYSTDRTNWTALTELSAESEDEATRLTDEVFYTAWDGEKYAFRRFDIAGMPVGDYYLAFEGGHCYVDNIEAFHKVDVAHDVIFAETKCPARAKVNTPYVGSVKVQNLNDKVEQADKYTVSLYFGDEKVAEVETQEIGAGATVELPFSYVPTLAGAYNVYVVFTAGDFSITSEATTVNVKAEDAESDVVVGTKTSLNRNAPLDLYNYRSQTETIYPAEMLNFAKGSGIVGLTYYGFCDKDLPTHITVWMENTDENGFVSPLDIHGTETMTKVYDADYTVKAGGTQSATIELLALSFDDSFKYTGGNLRVIVQSVSEKYATAYFEVDGGKADRTIGRATDYSSFNLANVETRNMPVTVFTVEAPSTTGISNAKAQQEARQRFTLQGFKATDSQRGLTIERFTNEKGEIIVRKVVK